MEPGCRDSDLDLGVSRNPRAPAAQGSGRRAAVIFPIGTNETSFRRAPWVTISLAVTCIAVFTATFPRMQEAQTRLHGAAEDVASHFLRHPYLEIDSRTLSLMSGRYLASDELERLRQMGDTAVAPSSHEAIDQAQRRLAELETRFLDEYDALPSRVWGLIPAVGRLRSWLTHMFMHGSWDHLIGNMVVLLLAGICLEERWGRLLFSLLYGIGGLAGAALFAFRYPEANLPLIGASGAISAVVGAFAVRFWSSRVYFFYWFWIVGTFWLPAWVVTLSWAGNELLMAYVIDAVAPRATGGSVAHWAHLGGFAFGAALGLVMKVSALESRVIDRKIDSTLEQYQNTLLVQALERRGSDPATAFALLARELPRQAYNRDAIEVFWDLGLELHRVPETASQIVRLVREDLKKGELESAAEYVLDLIAQAPDARLEPATLVRLGLELAERRKDRYARDVLEVALRRLGPGATLPSALRLARTLRGLDRRLAADAAGRVLATTGELSPDERQELEQIVSDGAPEELDP